MQQEPRTRASRKVDRDLDKAIEKFTRTARNLAWWNILLIVVFLYSLSSRGLDFLESRRQVDLLRIEKAAPGHVVRELADVVWVYDLAQDQYFPRNLWPRSRELQTPFKDEDRQSAMHQALDDAIEVNWVHLHELAATDEKLQLELDQFYQAAESPIDQLLADLDLKTMHGRSVRKQLVEEFSAASLLGLVGAENLPAKPSTYTVETALEVVRGAKRLLDSIDGASL